MSKRFTSNTERTHIRNGFMNGLQTYSVYDLLTRLAEHYEAPLGAKHGDPCFVTRYKYDGNTSIIVATQESTAVWDSAWDFDALP